MPFQESEVEKEPLPGLGMKKTRGQSQHRVDKTGPGKLQDETGL